MAIVVDLRPVELDVKFTLGSTVAFTLYYLGTTGQVLDLSTYVGKIVARDPEGYEALNFSKDLPIVVSDVDYQDTKILGANGLYIEYSSELTNSFPWDYLRFECLITSADGIITPIAVGTFEPCRL